ncbi:HRSL1 enzyme, partial [Certhia brachydactyla]|nr:HRSL1 enzyme [Certhia brachydactyla]
MSDDKQYPKPGDLIEIKQGCYEHWALYIGEGNVIHVTPVDDNHLSQSAGNETIFASKAQVKKQPLNDVAGDDYWCVNNKYDCYRIPFPMEEIVRRAEPWVDIEVPYNVLGKNCEHFGTMLRYGQGFSDQV